MNDFSQEIKPSLSMNTIGAYIVLVGWAIIFTFLSIYVINAYLPVYDMEFHLARMVGLAQSISNGDILPNLNHLFSYGTGYASSMFYGNWQFYPAAMVYIFTKDAIGAYTFFAFCMNSFAILSTFHFTRKLTQSKLNSFLVAMIVPCFYPAFGFGMTMVIGFVPMLFYAIYKVLYLEEYNPILLGVTIALLIQTHLLSTIVLAISSMFFVACNAKKINLHVLLSFGKSILIGLALSAGFLFQYVEQVLSQKFYFSWVTRNFPVDNKLMFDMSHNFHSGFTSLTNLYDVALKIAIFYFIINFFQLKPISKSLVGVIVLTYISMTGILPWHTTLKYTFLGNLQYTERLSYFLPVLIMMIFAIECNRRFLQGAVGAVFLVYLISFVLPYSVTHQKMSQKLMNQHNKLMLKAYEDAKNVFINPIGDEYYTLDVDNMAIRQDNFAEFSELENVKVSNIQYGYNFLQFDVEVQNQGVATSLVVPKVWYSGYKVSYSNGGKGSQAAQQKVLRTEEEVAKMKKMKMPVETEKVLHNGRIYLTIQESGTVTISHHKTILQYLGFLLEAFFWLFLVLYCYTGDLILPADIREKCGFLIE